MKFTDKLGLPIWNEPETDVFNIEHFNKGMKAIDDTVVDIFKQNQTTNNNITNLTDRITTLENSGVSSGGSTGLTVEQANNIKKIPSIEATVTSNSQAIANKADKNHKHTEYLKEIPDEYVTDTELSSKGYATETFVTNKIAEASLSGGNVDLSGYATKDDVPTKVSQLTNDKGYLSSVPSEYVTETELNSKGYLTEHQDISNLALKSEIPNTTSFATNLSLTGSKLQLKNSQGNLIGNAVTLPSTSSTATAFLNGKKYCAIGDSITYGVRTTKKYHEYLKEYFNLSSVTNLGIDGSTITSRSQGICDRLAKIPKDSDLITLFAGTNDFFFSMPLGEWYAKDSKNKRTLIKDKATFRGALNIICEYLIDNFSNKIIYLMTPIHRHKFMTQPTDLEPNSSGIYLEEYVNCIIECGKIYSLPVIDLYSKSGLFPSNTNNANLYFNPTSDYLHPNATGHKKIAQVIYKEIVNDMPLGSDYTPVVKTLSRISATYNQGSTKVYPSTSLDTLKTNLIVKAIYSDNSEDVVTTYNLSGTLSVGTSTITVTYSNKTTTFNVNVSEEQVPTKTLSSISAVYTQGSTVVYPSTSLNSLKGNIVVTATYSDKSTATITDYALSGTLNVGTSTITVTYQGKTTTFNVIVIATPTNYTITNNLTNVTNSNSATSIAEGSSYSAKVTATSGYEISSYGITMGGADITSTAYSDGNITISNVTGNIVITVTATKQASGGTGEYRAVTEDDLTVINATLTIDDGGYKLVQSSRQWNGARLTNVPKESKITLVQTNNGQCIWYMYKYDSSYMYVLCIGNGNGEHGKVYKMNISSNSATQNGTMSMTMTPKEGDILKVVVDGSSQTLYCNDTELCTLTDCNTVGISNQNTSNKYIASKWEVL